LHFGHVSLLFLDVGQQIAKESLKEIRLPTKRQHGGDQALGFGIQSAAGRFSKSTKPKNQKPKNSE